MNRSRIFRNSIFLYIRMLFLTILTLYTSRIALQQLGVVDFGIYNVVGGIVTMLGFFNSSMSVATQRYMSFDIGQGRYEQLKKTFNASLMIYIFIGLFIVIILETVGLWYVNNKLVFPKEKLVAVNVVYQLSILTFIVNLTQLPYNALVLAREKMHVYAYISFIDTVLKLVALYFLFLSESKLILYSVLILFATLLVRVIYQIYCNRNFPETKFIYVRDKRYVGELLTFSGWSLFGNIAAVARNQGINLVLNIIYGVTINATYAIAIQVQNAVGSFVSNFQKALNPQIIQNYAKGETSKSLYLVFIGTKFSYFLMLLILIPIYINIDFILTLWLGEYPAYTSSFVRLSLLVALVETLSGPLMTMAQATGKIKWYQIILGTLIMLNLPISYYVLNLTQIPYSFYYVIITISILSLVFRIMFVWRVAGMRLTEYFKRTILPTLNVTLVLLIIWCLYQNYYFPAQSFYELIQSSILVVIILTGVIFLVGLSLAEKKKLIATLKKMLGKNT